MRGIPLFFPEELARRVIKMYSFVGERVLDPFLGSGTTIKAARELGREGIGYEREEELYRGAIESKLEGTISKEDSESKETLPEYVERQLEELEESQPEEAKAEVIMSDGMVEAAAEITEKYQKTLELA